MFPVASLVFLTYIAVAHGQQVGTLTAESHPALTVEECTASGCTATELSVVLDANWRWLHSTSDSTNCYDGNEWNTALCPDGETCATACAVDGANYEQTYGISSSGDELSLQFVTGSNVGSRVYLMDEDDTNYKMFNLLNKEFTFDVDMSTLPCGLNGALYFVEMAADGGLSEFATNEAGSAYGTGYCDSQCPHDIKFINGLANVEGWNPSEGDPNSGAGNYGTCCAEMDIWEANSQAAAYTPHPCTVSGPTLCEGIDCGDGDDRYNGVCDKDGCDFNSWRMGDQTFLGPGLTVDTSAPFTVVTQFLTSDNTTTGELVEIRRLYVQNGEVIMNSVTAVDGVTETDSITDEYCTEQKTAFGDTNSFESKGSLAAMGASFDAGMVLVLSIWDDHAVNMLWLDSTYPTDADPSAPGVSRGPCATDSGIPEDVESESPGATVKFSAIKYGEIGSTYAF